MASGNRVAVRCVLFTAALGLVGVSCSSDDKADPADTAATTTSTIGPSTASDGRLTIGVMLPPAATLLRDPLSRATEDAIGQINNAGGIFDRPVRLIVVDEGDTAATGSDAVQQLLAQDVDAVVGPSSSVIALATLESIVSSDVVACSPSASALAIDGLPDRGLFFRTVPSDSMQAQAIVEITEQTGVQSVAIVHVDDAYGRPMAEAVSSALTSLSINVADTIGFGSSDDDLRDEVQRVVDSGARVVVLLADASDGAQFLEALGDDGSGDLSTIIVNDALRSAESTQRIGALRAGVRQKILGVAPQSESDDPAAPFDPPGPFATNAFDCITLLGLAASQAESDHGPDIAAQMSSVSAGGSVCRTFAECAQAIGSGLQIDYNGPSGLTEIDANDGDPTRARFDLFAFDDDGHDTLVSTFVVET